MRAGRVAMFAVGTVVSLLGLLALAAAAQLGWAAAGQDRDGYLDSPTWRLSTGGAALVSEPFTLLPDGEELPPFLEEGAVRLRLRASAGGQEVFVGVARSADVDTYLAGAAYSEVSGPVGRDPRYHHADGDRPLGRPGDQGFWVASGSGPGQQEAVWDISPGSWRIVVMNADGAAGVRATVQAGAHVDMLPALAAAALAAAVVLLAVGLPLLIAGAHGMAGPGAGPGGPEPPAGAADAPGPYPARLRGDLDGEPSRWLWLVKWLLAVPHYIVLLFLLVAFAVLTVVAGVAILFTGRYPRRIFEFNTGVMRWSWRVGFYAYSALGTDRYPPFTLRRTGYPADFDVDYPQRLSRGLVLVKWWLLAVPHYLVVGALVGGGVEIASGGDGSGSRAVLPLLGALVLIAAVALLFTGRYPRGVFDFLLGISRWTYRVWAYAALMRDEYPPFRLDQGPREPGGTTPEPAAARAADNGPAPAGHG